MSSGMTPGSIGGIFEADEATDEADEATDEADESFGESPLFSRPSAYYSRTSPARTGLIRTDRGSAQVQFTQGFVKYSDFKEALDNVRRDVSRNQQAIVSLDKRVGSNVKRLKDNVQQTQNSSMFLPLLSFLQPPPKIASITFSEDYKKNEPVNVFDNAFKPQDNTFMLMMMMMMMMSSGGGGLFGSGDKGMDSQGMMMMMMMMMVVMGGLGGSQGTTQKS